MIDFNVCIVIKILSLQFTQSSTSELIQIWLRQGRELKEASQKILTPALTVINQ